MDRSYAADVADGTQWVLWIQQGDRERSVYFDNHFPEAITTFAKHLDAILSMASGPNLQWQPVLPPMSRRHESELWECIKR
jgi:hypothetical protein